MGELFAATVLSGPLAVALLLSIVAGLVAFVSPCVLPVVPGCLGYITGLTGQSTGSRSTGDPGERPWRLVAGAVLFVAGFTAVFLVIGGFIGAPGSLMVQYTSVINRISGVLVILMGLVFVGIFPRLSGERRIRKRPDAGLAGAPLSGSRQASPGPRASGRRLPRSRRSASGRHPRAAARSWPSATRSGSGSRSSSSPSCSDAPWVSPKCRPVTGARSRSSVDPS